MKRLRKTLLFFCAQGPFRTEFTLSMTNRLQQPKCPKPPQAGSTMSFLIAVSRLSRHAYELVIPTFRVFAKSTDCHYFGLLG